MIPTNILNIFINQEPFFLFTVTIVIIAILLIKLLWSELSNIFAFIMKWEAKILIVSIILILMTLYSSVISATSFVSSLTNIANIHISGTTNSLLLLTAVISLGVSALLGIILLFIEGERILSPTLKEIDNIEINNLGKIAIKLLSIASFILAIILAYSILFLAMFPTNITLINTIPIIAQIYILIVASDMMANILIPSFSVVSIKQ